MWFRPLLGGGCVNSTDWAEQTNGRTFHQNDPDGNRTPDLPLVGRALYGHFLNMFRGLCFGAYQASKMISTPNQHMHVHTPPVYLWYKRTS